MTYLVIKGRAAPEKCPYLALFFGLLRVEVYYIFNSVARSSKKPQNILYHYYYYLDPHAFHAMENGNVLVAVVLVYNRRFDENITQQNFR